MNTQASQTRESDQPLQAFAIETDGSQDTKLQGRAILLGMAITVLVFINVGIFYTTKLTRDTGSAVTLTEDSKVTKTKLDTVTLEKLQNRTVIDIEAKLTPYTSGKNNPFK